MARLAREDFIVVLLFAALGLVVPTVVVARHFFGVDLLSWLQIEWSWGRTALGVVFAILATAICLWNFYVSLVVPWHYERRHGGMEGFAHTSGLPIVGGVCVLLGGALLPSSVLAGVFLLVLYALDGNGIPWFFASIIRYGV